MIFSAIVKLGEALLKAARGLPGFRREQKRMAILRRMLEDPRYKWREIDTLARAVGTSEEKTRDLLISVGARASTAGGREVWGLIARVDGP